jgi:hypothetical protein
MGRTSVKATAGDTTVTGDSGNNGYNQKQIGASTFWEDVFRHVKQKEEKWSQWACAETNAVAKLVAKGKRWQDIKFTLAADAYGTKSECLNCSQWIYNGAITPPDKPVGSYSEAAKNRAAESPKAQQKDFNLNMDEFPPLGEGKK